MQLQGRRSFIPKTGAGWQAVDGRELCETVLTSRNDAWACYYIISSRWNQCTAFTACTNRPVTCSTGGDKGSMEVHDCGCRDGDVYVGSRWNTLSILYLFFLLTPLAGLAFAWATHGTLWDTGVYY